MKKSKKLLTVAGCFVLLVVLAVVFFFTPLRRNKEIIVNVYDGESAASVSDKIAEQSKGLQMLGFKMAASVLNYKGHVRSGHYEFTGEGAMKVVRRLRSGMQTPVKLTIPSVRTADKLASELSKKLMIDSTIFLQAFQDEALCQKYDCDTATILTLFIPNTYEMYWNIPLEKFFSRMQKEYNAFWTPERLNL